MMVGAFVLMLGAALVTILVWLSAARGDESYATYIAYMTESVAGLNENAKVQYNGVDVGHVGTIDLDVDDPSRVRVTLEIEDGTPIRADTVATLTSSGITGVARVELSGGTTEMGPLTAAEGEDYPVIQTAPSLFVRLDESISGLVTELTGAAGSLTSVANRVEGLLDEENSETISAILTNVEEFTADLDGIAEQVAAVTGNVERASAELPAVIVRAEQVLAAYEVSAGSIDQAGRDISAAALGLDESVAGVALGVNRAITDLSPLTRGTSSQLVHLVDELQLLASTLRRVSEDIEQNPEMMLFGRPEAVRGPGE
jgi:phospholipid/cholesterol/gamma-HCH transport system substrate-binding protein